MGRAVLANLETPLEDKGKKRPVAHPAGHSGTPILQEWHLCYTNISALLSKSHLRREKHSKFNKDCNYCSFGFTYLLIYLNISILVQNT